MKKLKRPVPALALACLLASAMAMPVEGKDSSNNSAGVKIVTESVNARDQVVMAGIVAALTALLLLRRHSRDNP